MDQRWIRSSVRDFPLYYNPKITGSPLRMDTNTNPLGENPAGKKALRECLEMDLDSIRTPTRTV